VHVVEKKDNVGEGQIVVFFSVALNVVQRHSKAFAMCLLLLVMMQ